MVKIIRHCVLKLCYLITYSSILLRSIIAMWAGFGPAALCVTAAWTRRALCAADTVSRTAVLRHRLGLLHLLPRSCATWRGRLIKNTLRLLWDYTFKNLFKSWLSYALTQHHVKKRRWSTLNLAFKGKDDDMRLIICL